MTNQFSQKEGQSLLELARKSILGQLEKSDEAVLEMEKKVSENITGRQRGIFVSLHKKGELRGCIGNLEPEKTVFEGVKENAQYAAFKDSRFHPVSASEMKDLQIEVSILSPMKALEYESSTDLISKLRRDIDGVMIKKGHHRATFLPQVWKQLDKPEAFLANLCVKAGLPADEWKSGSLAVYIYQVQSFEENS